jgi:predicted amidohydrolase
VCADGRIPTIAATLIERGAQILVMPTAWVTSGRDPDALENIQADLMANVRARENGVPFVVANKCGVECESVAYCGKSAVIDARGAFVARAGETTAEIALGEVELARSVPPPRRRGHEPAEDAAVPGEPRTRARIAFTPADERADVERLAALAAFADCDLLVARGPHGHGIATMTPALATESVELVGSAEAPVLAERAGLRYAVVRDATLHDPRGLVELRLAGIDLFVWESRGDDWCVRFARTRAAELRAYVLVFSADGIRSFAVDPDGAVVAGTFGGFRMASFVYDRSRTQATTVAPTTDVFAGLRLAEAIRAR